ncbi:class C sortase [Enterococcus sp. 5H]|uniref:class C sortase n=1 Tax=Enterococcus sp. 5H TaxID=1229490 RepID=UPI002303A66E|nr:class C sortase [Enterococcus sp. 5H]
MQPKKKQPVQKRKPQRTQVKDKKSWRKFLVVALYIVGISVISYPFVSNALYKHAQKQAITQYEDTVANKEQKQQELIKKEMQQYNEGLLGNATTDYAIEAERTLLSPSDHAKKKELGEVIGIVEIPKINVELPIYNGTNEEQITRGAGLMQGTSLPYGGESAHSVLSSHRGLPQAKLFTDLPKLELGDMFFIKVENEIHSYQVDQIETIDPNDFSLLGIENGEDYVTLLTCTPYMVNTHRLLVRGKRVNPYKKEDHQKEARKGIWERIKKILLYALLILAILLFFYLVKRYRDKQAQKKVTKEKQTQKNKKTTEKRERGAQRTKKDRPNPNIKKKKKAPIVSKQTTGTTQKTSSVKKKPTRTVQNKEVKKSRKRQTT